MYIKNNTKNVEFFKKNNIPITEFTIFKNNKGKKAYKFFTKKKGKEWQNENRINNVDKINDIGINFQYIKEKEILYNDNLVILCIDVDLNNDKNKEIFNLLNDIFKKNNLCYETSYSNNGFHLFFLFNKNFVGIFATHNFFLQPFRHKNNGIDIYYDHGQIHINDFPNWNLLLDDNSMFKEFNIINFFELMYLIESNIYKKERKTSIFNTNNLIDSNINNNYPPLINKTPFDEYVKKYDELSNFIDGNIPQGTIHNSIFNNKIPHIYFLFDKWQKFLPKITEHYNDHYKEFVSLNKNPRFLKHCNFLRKILNMDKKLDIYNEINNIYINLKKKHKIKLGKYSGINNFSGRCLISIDYHIKFETYEWIKNQILIKAQERNLLTSHNIIFNIQKCLRRQPTNQINNNELKRYMKGIVFNNLFFDLENLSFTKNKTDSMVKFAFDFDPTPFSWTDKHYPNLKFFVENLKKFTKSKKIALIILVNLMDFNSDKRFLLFLKGKADQGKTWFVDFLNRLFPNYSTAVDYNYIQNNQETFKAQNNLFLYDNDIIKKDLKYPSSMKKIITGDDMSSKRLYSDPSTIKSIATLIFCTNHNVVIDKNITSDDGIRRRTYYLNWTEPLFKGNKLPLFYQKNKLLTPQLKTEFISGALNYLIYQKEIKNKSPFEIKDYQKIIRHNSNLIFENIKNSGEMNIFLHNIFSTTQTTNSENIEINDKIIKVRKSYLWTSYIHYCSHNNIMDRYKQNELYTKLETDFNFVNKPQGILNKKSVRIYEIEYNDIKEYLKK